MLRKSFIALLAAVVVLSLAVVQRSFALEKTAEPLIGSWTITHRPVNAQGQPCPFLPESMKFFNNQTLVMSNMPSRQFPFKTELTAGERKALEERSEDYQGKNLLLVKPVPQMAWEATPMVYAYTVGKDELVLNIQGWEPAKFKRGK